jgi:hypothetical protein
MQKSLNGFLLLRALPKVMSLIPDACRVAAPRQTLCSVRAERAR